MVGEPGPDLLAGHAVVAYEVFDEVGASGGPEVRIHQTLADPGRAAGAEDRTADTVLRVTGRESRSLR
ncbi:hypothetical protein GCM10028833_36620 [Glycomyces tarimensis]